MRTYDPDMFKLRTELPAPLAEMPILRVLRAQEILRGTDTDTFSLRVQNAIEQFEMSGEVEVTEERAVVWTDTRSLEVFRASDSVWWTDHAQTNRESVPAAVQFASHEQAVASAKKYVAEARLEPKGATFEHASTSYTEASSDQEPNPSRTAMDVDFTIKIAEQRVFGPGAKIKVTTGHSLRPAQIARFHREYEVESVFQPISPEVALDRFKIDEMFASLNSQTALVEIVGMSFGYHAAPPAELQRYYTPVFAIDAIANTSRQSKYEFRYYVDVHDKSDEMRNAEIKRWR